MAAVSLPGLALAHDFWIQPSAFWVAPGGATNMSILVGHGSYRSKSLIEANRITLFDRYGPDGRSDRRGELKLGTATSDTALRFGQAGEYMFALATNATPSELPGIRFTDYLKVEGLTPALALRAQTGTTDAPGRELYSRRAKALIQVGNAAKANPKVADVATQRIGLSLELVLERDPYALAPGADLPVRVFFEGRPLVGGTVKLNNLDFDERPLATRVTDPAGRVLFRVPRIGNWQLNVIWTKPIKGNPKADFETTFSSLTFGYPRPQMSRRAP
ncbi:MAG: DUF4198 domain-containing protein [Novosphingobium sp.]